MTLSSRAQPCTIRYMAQSRDLLDKEPKKKTLRQAQGDLRQIPPLRFAMNRMVHGFAPVGMTTYRIRSE